MENAGTSAGPASRADAKAKNPPKTSNRENRGTRAEVAVAATGGAEVEDAAARAEVEDVAARAEVEDVAARAVVAAEVEVVARAEDVANANS